MRLVAASPPEKRGLTRDGVRLLVATPDGLVHARFTDLPLFLAPGDLLVANTSATVAAALDGARGDGRPVVVHLSTTLDDGTWLLELRERSAGFRRVTDAVPGETLTLPGGASLSLLYRYPDKEATRMWAASAAVGGDVSTFLTRHGRPIRYSYVPDPWPLAAYQTVFARSSGSAGSAGSPGATGLTGSAEMPSAGRPFTPGLVTSLISAGVMIAPITLHAGVASLEAGETPLPERFTVPEATARLVNMTRAAGHRVVAVGTTCTRALESAADANAAVRPRSGWTRLVLGPRHPARVVDGLVTGWHDPEASHLALLDAVAGTPLVRPAYAEAERAGYLWHEFGDSCLLLPPPRGRPHHDTNVGAA